MREDDRVNWTVFASGWVREGEQVNRDRCCQKLAGCLSEWLVRAGRVQQSGGIKCSGKLSLGDEQAETQTEKRRESINGWAGRGDCCCSNSSRGCQSTKADVCRSGDVLLSCDDDLSRVSGLGLGVTGSEMSSTAQCSAVCSAVRSRQGRAICTRAWAAFVVV